MVPVFARAFGPRSLRVFLWPVVLGAWLGLLAPVVSWAQTASRVEIEDELVVDVVGQEPLTGRYSVESDGTSLFPLAGRIHVLGLTEAELEETLRRRLAAYISGPRIRVSIARPESVFVFGAVKSPGRYPFTAGLTVIQVLASAGYPAGAEVLIIRSPGATGPVNPALADPADVQRINLQDVEQAIERGYLSRNLPLQPNDTIFVPVLNPAVVHVTGEVRNPGPHPVSPGTTVLQALTLAGGTTERAAVGGIRIARIADGDLRVFGADLSEQVQAGDGLEVPEVFTLPPVFAVTQDQQEDLRQRSTMRLSRFVSVTPGLMLNRIGLDTNVLNDPAQPESDFITDVRTQLAVQIDLTHLQLTGKGGVSALYFRDFTRQRTLSPSYAFGLTVPVTRSLKFGAAREVGETHGRMALEDVLVQLHEERLDAGVNVRFARRFTVDLTGRESRTEFQSGYAPHDIDLRPLLTGTLQRATAAIGYDLSSVSTVKLIGTAATHRLPLFPLRNADATDIALGVTLRRGAVIDGSVQVGFLRYVTLAPGAPDFEGLSGNVRLAHVWRERTELGVRFERKDGTSIQPQFAFATVDRYGLWIHRGLSDRFDVVAEGSYEQQHYRPFGAPEDEFRQKATVRVDDRRYMGQFGFRTGDARIALDAAWVTRMGQFGFSGLRVGATVSYGVIDVRNRCTAEC